VFPTFVTSVLHASPATLVIEGASDALLGVSKIAGGPLARGNWIYGLRSKRAGVAQQWMPIRPANTSPPDMKALPLTPWSKDMDGTVTHREPRNSARACAASHCSRPRRQASGRATVRCMRRPDQDAAAVLVVRYVVHRAPDEAGLDPALGIKKRYQQPARPVVRQHSADAFAELRDGAGARREGAH
jgi:hypothetical protein